MIVLVNVVLNRTVVLTVTDVSTTCAVVIFTVKDSEVSEVSLSETLTLKMTTEQVVEKSVPVNNNSAIQDYVHPDDQTQPTFKTPLFEKSREDRPRCCG